MHTSIRQSVVILTICLLAGFICWGQRGPQDTWYETGRGPLPENCDPHGLIITPEGTLLISDTTNDNIHELDENGSLIRSFGSFGTSDGQFQEPTELAIGPKIESMLLIQTIIVSKFLREMVLFLKHLGSMVLVMGNSINLGVLRSLRTMRFL